MIGNDNNINIWDDAWVALGVFLENYSGNSLETVNSLIDHNNTKSWNLPLIREVCDLYLVKKVIATRLPWVDFEDNILWPYSKEGSYNVKQGFKVARQSNVTEKSSNPSSSYVEDKSIWKYIWGIQSNIKIFIWKLCKNAPANQVQSF